MKGIHIIVGAAVAVLAIGGMVAYKFMDGEHPIKQTMDELKEVSGCHLDIHQYNIMVRKPEKQLVLMDPLAR